MSFLDCNQNPPKEYIKVKVFPDAGKETVIEKPKRIEIWTKEPAQDNRANKDAVRILAEYLGLDTGKVRLVSGHRTQSKTFEIIR